MAVVATALFSIAVRSQASYYIDPTSVPIATRRSWCVSQSSVCPLLCTQINNGSQTTTSNDCDAATLTFDCVCGNGLSPNASEFSQTIPFFECQEYGNQCVAACGGNTPCQSACRQDHPCGAQNPTRVNTTTTATMASTTADVTGTGAAVFTGLAGATTTPSSSTKKNAGNAALDMGRAYGLAVVGAGIFAGFALVL